jgi:hypothetical protein
VPKLNRNIWLALAAFSVFICWICLEATGVLPEAARHFADGLPDWFFIANLLVAPALAGFACAEITIRPGLRVLFLIAILISISLFGLCYQRYPVATLAVGAFLFVETFWMIPKWKARHRSG